MNEQLEIRSQLFATRLAAPLGRALRRALFRRAASPPAERPAGSALRAAAPAFVPGAFSWAPGYVSSKKGFFLTKSSNFF